MTLVEGVGIERMAVIWPASSALSLAPSHAGLRCMLLS